MARIEFPQTLEAVGKAERGQWAIGDALLKEIDLDSTVDLIQNATAETRRMVSVRSLLHAPRCWPSTDMMNTAKYFCAHCEM